jgi:hypothetical protein
MDSPPSLSARRQKLSPEQLARLEHRVARAVAESGNLTPPITPGTSDNSLTARPGRTSRSIPRRDPAQNIPLSTAQERLWFLHQFQSLPQVYNRPSTLRLLGTLDVAALKNALREILRRHEALRMSFPLRGDAPVVRVAPPGEVDTVAFDLRGRPDALREVEARRCLEQENFRAFDLDSGPLIRACILRLADQEHWLSVTVHHVVFDGWSAGVLWRELGLLYSACVAGQPSPLPELPIQYGDFAAWQRQRFVGTDHAADLAYWKQRLAGARSTLDLKPDFPRPRIRSYRGARHPICFDGPTVEALRSIGAAEGATLFMTLLAAFQLLLARVSGQHDICVGTPVAGRVRPELEGLIGCFINTLVLRADLSGDPTFRQFLSHVRENTLGAFAHQELPFEHLVAALNPKRSLDRTPLFEVLLILRNTPTESLNFSELQVHPLEVGNPTAKFDLTLALDPDGPALVGVLEYSTDLFRPETIAKLSARLFKLIRGIIQEPNSRLSELPLWGPGLI